MCFVCPWSLETKQQKVNKLSIDTSVPCRILGSVAQPCAPVQSYLGWAFEDRISKGQWMKHIFACKERRKLLVCCTHTLSKTNLLVGYSKLMPFAFYVQLQGIKSIVHSYYLINPQSHSILSDRWINQGSETRLKMGGKLGRDLNFQVSWLLAQALSGLLSRQLWKLLLLVGWGELFRSCL